MNPKVDEFINKTTKWHEEMVQLRAIVLECGLVEELKWGVPCYTYKGSNILIIHGFKEYCALNLFNGVLLNDAEGMLIQQNGECADCKTDSFQKSIRNHQNDSHIKSVHI